MTLWTPPPPTVGFDTSARLSLVQAVQLAAAGYRFALRYVLAPHAAVMEDPITVAEADALRAAGLAVGLLQGFQQASQINGPDGIRDGNAAASEALAVGYPVGATLWCDLEGRFGSAQPLIDYLNNWGRQVKAAGFIPGLYNGPQNVLNAAQIQALIFPAYWCPGAKVPKPARGYQLFQMLPASIPAPGTAIDVDVVERDARGDLPVFWGPA